MSVVDPTNGASATPSGKWSSRCHALERHLRREAHDVREGGWSFWDVRWNAGAGGRRRAGIGSGPGGLDRYERARARRARAAIAGLLRRRALSGDQFQLDPDRLPRPRAVAYRGRTDNAWRHPRDRSRRTTQQHEERGARDERIELTLRGELNRRDFGLTWNQALETGGALLGNKVKIALELSGVKHEAP